nr:RNA-directed DNA polymerase, eukaryota, reverse transcriptase zinc-binding domain protein [Tanacetum cinerariifolium]
MSSVRQNVKRQIKVPIKLANFDYGLVNRKKKKQSMIDENMCKDSLEAVVEEVNVEENTIHNESRKESVDVAKSGKESVLDETEVNQRIHVKEARKEDMGNGKDENVVNQGINTQVAGNGGISAVASRLGTPQRMDQTTTQMCKMGYGRVGFARVLIGVEAEKGLPEKIEIVYKNRDGLVTAKNVPKTIEEVIKIEREELKRKYDNAEFEQVRYKKRDGKKVNQNVGNKNGKKGTNSSRVFYKRVEKEGIKDGQDIINSIRKNANKYAVLKEENVNERVFEDGIELGKENIDVYEETSGSTKKMAQNDITSSYADVLNGTGLGKVCKQNAVKNLIADEKISICAILETRLKDSKVRKIGDRLFGRWNWYNNAIECIRGCKTLIGWDTYKVQCMIVHASDQAVLCLFEIQRALDADPKNSHIREKGISLFKEYNLALEDEEKLLLQKTKVDWVRYSGDKVPLQFVIHFQKFLGDQNNKECLDLDENKFSKKIDEQEAYNMINANTNKEIKEAMFDIDDKKFQAVTEFFLKGKLLGELNATLITLVPKAFRVKLLSSNEVRGFGHVGWGQ